jgi:hypothetical protein
VTEKRGISSKQIIHDFKEKRSSWKLKEEETDRIVWGTFCGRGYGPVLRETTE